MLKAIYDTNFSLARRMVQLNGLALLLVAIVVAVDVICRKFLNITLAGSDEISGYVLAVSSVWAYSYCLLHRSHIRIDVVYNLVSFRLKCLFDVIGLLALLIFISVLTHGAIGVLTESLERGSVSNTPLLTPMWIPQSLWVAGLLFFSLTLIVLCTYSIVSLIRGDMQTVRRIAGVPTLAEEIEMETQNTADAPRAE